MSNQIPKYKKTCLVCGTDFYSHYMTAKFCSDECRQSAMYHTDFGSEEVSRNMRFDMSWVDSRKKTHFDNVIDELTPEGYIAKKKRIETDMYARVQIPPEILLIQAQRELKRMQDEQTRNGKDC